MRAWTAGSEVADWGLRRTQIHISAITLCADPRILLLLVYRKRTASRTTKKPGCWLSLPVPCDLPKTEYHTSRYTTKAVPEGLRRKLEDIGVDVPIEFVRGKELTKAFQQLSIFSCSASAASPPSRTAACRTELLLMPTALTPRSRTPKVALSKRRTASIVLQSSNSGIASPEE